MDFFGKTFKITLIALLGVEVLSLFSHLVSSLNQVVFFLILLITLLTSLRRLEYGLYIILAELFVGSHGYLFSLSLGGVTISLRIALFLVVMAVWLFRLIQAHFKPLPKFNLIYANYLVLSIIILAGFVLGIINNGFANAFFDFNGWLYFGLIFLFFTVVKNEAVIKNIFAVLIAAGLELSIKTLLTLLLFSHGLAQIGDSFYKWVRDTRVGEITYVNGSIFRIFFQSQIFILIGLLVLLFMLIISQRQNYQLAKKIPIYLYLYLASLAILISQSRSFWLGGLAGLGLIVLIAWQRYGFGFRKTIILTATLLMVFSSQILLVQLLTGNFSQSLISNRFKNLQVEPAGSSRLNELAPLKMAIDQKIFFGYGFGKELTYQSHDPRILQSHPGGLYTTYAFEWGYLDIWLKLGLLGLLVYLILILQLSLKLWQKKQALHFGLLAGLLALVVTNIFSPYLNHPLGIGYLILLSTLTTNQNNLS